MEINLVCLIIMMVLIEIRGKRMNLNEAKLFSPYQVLNDKPFVEHTVESFLSATEVKIKVTNLLDQVSRQEPVRSSLDHFVVFSSIVGYHGNQGQTNYAYGNSAAERICERRKVDGLPGQFIIFIMVLTSFYKL